MATEQLQHQSTNNNTSGKDIFIDREDVKYYSLSAGVMIRCFVDNPPEGRPQGVNPEILLQQSGDGNITNAGYEPASKR